VADKDDILGNNVELIETALRLKKLLSQVKLTHGQSKDYLHAH